MIHHTTGIQAAQPKPETGEGRDTTGFQAAPAGSEERFSGSTLLVEAYAAIWLILMAWLLLLWRKQASLTARLDAKRMQELAFRKHPQREVGVSDVDG